MSQIVAPGSYRLLLGEGRWTPSWTEPWAAAFALLCVVSVGVASYKRPACLVAASWVAYLVLFYLVVYLFMNLGAFTLAGLIEKGSGTLAISNWTGLWRRNTIVAILMLVLLGMHVTSDQVAIFNASYRLAMIVTFGLTAIDAVTSPVAARLYAAKESSELQAVVARATQLGFWCSLAAVAGFAVLGSWLLGLFGPEFVAGYDTMMILITAQLVRSAAGPVVSLLSVTGHQQRCLPVFGSSLIGAILLVFILVPTFGIRGAAIAVLLVTLGWSVWLHRLVVVHIGIRPSIFGIYARG